MRRTELLLAFLITDSETGFGCSDSFDVSSLRYVSEEDGAGSCEGVSLRNRVGGRRIVPKLGLSLLLASAVAVRVMRSTRMA